MKLVTFGKRRSVENVLEEDIVLKRSRIESVNNYDILFEYYDGTSGQRADQTLTTILGTVELFRESEMISLKGFPCRLYSPNLSGSIVVSIFERIVVQTIV